MPRLEYSRRVKLKATTNTLSNLSEREKTLWNFETNKQNLVKWVSQKTIEIQLGDVIDARMASDCSYKRFALIIRHRILSYKRGKQRNWDLEKSILVKVHRKWCVLPGGIYLAETRHIRSLLREEQYNPHHPFQRRRSSFRFCKSQLLVVTSYNRKGTNTELPKRY